MALIKETTVEIKRIGMTILEGRDFLMHNFNGRRSRQHLSDDELELFLKMLKELK